MADESIYSFATLRNRLVMRGTLVALTALRIGAGRASDVLGNDLPVLRDALRRPFIPGASLKGALRARTETLIRAVSPDDAVLDLEQLEQRTRELRAFRERNRDLSDAEFSRMIWELSTVIDLTFGSPELAGRLFLKDALVEPSIWFDQFEVRNGVVLNRDTETAEEGLLYDYEVVPAGTRFDFELVLENADDWQIGMVMLALKPWERGEAQIGGFRSRGLGYVQLEIAQRHFIAVTDVDDVLRLLEDGVTDTVDDVQAEAWYQAFRAKLRDLAQATTTGGQ
jgi:CRISPR-associated RAMP protein (TIGR02581 family)